VTCFGAVVVVIMMMMKMMMNDGVYDGSIVVAPIQ
jgi:hypothetical protein